ncbi:unnamed protein product [Callosobruchus maculatus]|uniref:Uncharacterized protein n=1 Tax=Callosobruchus maculatus TaxID=64391 RepID=A0A653CQF5_CALMS|nr:unnamed protein product [Callosobruchus maculatus]
MLALFFCISSNVKDIYVLTIFTSYKMGLGALLCVLSWAIVGSCYPITEVNTVESDTVQVLSQTVEYTDNVSSRAPKEQQVKYKTVELFFITILVHNQKSVLFNEFE